MLLLALGALLLAALIGRLHLTRELTRLESQRDYLGNYVARFDLFAVAYQRGIFDNEQYQWLTRNVVAAQKKLGYHGIVAYFKPPGYSMMPPTRNYQLLMNSLPELKKATWTVEALRSLIDMCQAAFLRCIGDLEEQIHTAHEQLHNPFMWIIDGTRLIITFPFRLWAWGGALNESKYETIANSNLARAASALITLLEIVASIIQIAQWIANGFRF